MGVHSNNCCGPHGSALQKAKGTISECTPERERDHMGVHSSKRRGPHESALVSYLFNRIRVHSHVVSNKLLNALPCGPFCFLECTPMWSVTIFGVHSDLVLITFENALRSDPPYKMLTFSKIIPFT